MWRKWKSHNCIRRCASSFGLSTIKTLRTHTTFREPVVRQSIASTWNMAHPNDSSPSLSKNYYYSDQSNRFPMYESLILVFMSYLICDKINCDDDTKLTGQDLVNAVKRKIIDVRENLRRSGRRFEYLRLQTQDSRDIISIVLNPGDDFVRLLSQWISIISPSLKSHNFSPLFADKTENIIGFTVESIDKSSRVVIESSNGKYLISVEKHGGYSQHDLDVLMRGYYDCFAHAVESQLKDSSPDIAPNNFLAIFDHFNPGNLSIESNVADNTNSSSGKSTSDPIRELSKLGIDVYDRSQNSHLTWNSLAGYDNVKRDIEDTVVNAYKYPDIYDAITRNTRTVFESNRPKAILLEGLPGTGKTLTARILANICDIPFVHLKLESVVSKWYGEAEKRLAKVFELCEKMDGAIIFIDEIDTVATSRDDHSMHEATRHLLSVVLQQIEGFQGKGKSLLVCATNRKQDLDAALLSRIDLSIYFDLPDFNTRKSIFSYYAKQFKEQEKILNNLADETDGMSCRDLKDICEQSERQCASRKIRKETSGDFPSFEEYLKSIQRRKATRSIPALNSASV